jgi:hypothetical protein
MNMSRVACVAHVSIALRRLDEAAWTSFKTPNGCDMGDRFSAFFAKEKSLCKIVMASGLSRLRNHILSLAWENRWSGFSIAIKSTGCSNMDTIFPPNLSRVKK